MVNKALNREEIVVIALLEKVKKTKTKKNKEDMAFLTLSDLSTVISNCIVFPELFKDAYYNQGILKDGNEVLKISGYKSINERGESFIATGLEKLG
jgi:DNA polymerase III alpha subunit